MLKAPSQSAIENVSIFFAWEKRVAEIKMDTIVYLKFTICEQIKCTKDFLLQKIIMR